MYMRITIELPGFCELLQGVHQGLCGQGISNATTHEAQGRDIQVEYRGRGIISKNKERSV